MADLFRDLQSFYSTTLAASISASDTLITVSTAPLINTAFLVLEPRTSNEEIVLMISRAGNILTVVRGLAFSGSSEAGAGLGKSHGAGTAVENADVHYYIKKLQSSAAFQFRGAVASSSNLSTIANPEAGDLAFVSDEQRFYRYSGSAWVKMGNNTESIDGIKTFLQAPQVPTPAVANDAVNLAYVLGLTFASAIVGFDRMTVTYDALGRIKAARDNAQGITYIISYDVNDNPVKIFDGTNTWHLNYSGDNLISITKP